MVRRLYLLSTCLVFISCNKGDDNKTETPDKDWNVRYEVVSETSGDLVLVQWSNGVKSYMTGTTIYTTWPLAPWTKDTVFKTSDGNRIIELNVVKSMNSGTSNITGQVTSRIYVNGKVIEEARGINQFLKTGLQ